MAAAAARIASPALARVVLPAVPAEVLLAKVRERNAARSVARAAVQRGARAGRELLEIDRERLQAAASLAEDCERADGA